MVVEVSGEKYKISFFHVVHGNPPSTYCYIFPGDNKEAEPKVIGLAILSNKDKYNKAIGRKVALTRALNYLFPDNKEARRQVWNKYVATCRVS